MLKRENNWEKDHLINIQVEKRLILSAQTVSITLTPIEYSKI